MRSDVGDGRALAPFFRLEAPRKVGLFEQPVLQVLSVHEMHRTDLAGRNHLARLLDQRIAAIIERDRMDDAGPGRRVEQAAGFSRRHRQRLVRDHVLAMGERRHDDRHVQIIRRGVVNDMDVGIGDERFVAAVGFRDAKRVGLAPRGRVGAGRDGNDVDEAETAHGVDVMGADEPGADKVHSDAGHRILDRRRYPTRRAEPPCARRRDCRAEAPCARGRIRRAPASRSRNIS